MSVIVEKRLPVSVFCAVTVTPGRGVLPLLTTPCSLPPVIVSPEAAGSGATGGGVGAYAKKTRLSATIAPINTVVRRYARRIQSPHAHNQGFLRTLLSLPYTLSDVSGP